MSQREDRPSALDRWGRWVVTPALVAVVLMIALALQRVVADEPDAGVAVATPSSASTDRSALQEFHPVFTDVSFVDVRRGDVTNLPSNIRLISDAGHVQVSPDGSSLAFDDGHQIYVAGIDGTDLRAVTEGSVASVTPSWSPDGTELVYVRDGNLFVADVGSGVSRHLTDLPGKMWRMWLPSFSPDGRTILFTMTGKGGGKIDLWTMPSVGGKPMRLLEKAAFGAFSPDGTTIAYFRVPLAVEPWTTWPWDFVLRLASADGTPLRSISAGNGGNTMAPFDWDWMRPAWSPDGTRIAYQAQIKGPPGDIRIVDVATRDATFIGSGGFPSWIDGTTLVIEDYRRGQG